MRLTSVPQYSYLSTTEKPMSKTHINNSKKTLSFSGNSSFMVALAEHNPEKLTKALQDGASVNEKYLEFCKGQSFGWSLIGINKPVYNEMTGLHMVVDRNRSSDSQNIQKCLQVLLNHGLNINAREGETKWTALHRHMYQWSPDPKVTQFLLNKGIDVNAKSKWKRTALHEYIDRSFCTPKLPIIKLLVEKDTDIHAKDDFGKTALYYLADNRKLDLDIVQYLIASGKTPWDRLALKQDFLSKHQNYLEHNIPRSPNSKPTKKEQQQYKAEVADTIVQLKRVLSVEKLIENNNSQSGIQLSSSHTNLANPESRPEEVSEPKSTSDKSPEPSKPSKSSNGRGEEYFFE